jgi:hypothetical protein
LHGDSQSVVPKLARELNEPCLWWLDAGYCGWAGAAGRSDRLGGEMEAILSAPVQGHVILMDDADGVVGLDDLLRAIQRNYPGRQVEVAHNIIRITPRTT